MNSESDEYSQRFSYRGSVNVVSKTAGNDHPPICNGDDPIYG